MVLRTATLTVVLSGCIGSGVDVPPTHPAHRDAPVATLPTVGAMLTSDTPTAPPAEPAADPHAHHHHHHGSTP